MAQYEWMAAAWAEQRDWAVRYAVDALRGAGAVASELLEMIEAALAELQPVASLTIFKGASREWTPVVLDPSNGGSGVLMRVGGWCDVQVDKGGGLFLRDATGVSSHVWSSSNTTVGSASAEGLGALRYQTLNDGSYDEFRREYLLDPLGDSGETYGKPGLSAEVAPERIWRPVVTQAFLSNGSRANEGGVIAMAVQFPAQAHAEFGAPSEAWLRLEVSGIEEARSLNLTIQLVNKTSS